ncbi:caspase-6-like [Mya arenaria]|uniref:caspase-6-like n=1 Tax=Mya arenaria TaxID=6604 RepID=UPI0022DEF2D4|nr:caspase-6-like [Mya arenaria]
MMADKLYKTKKVYVAVFLNKKPNEKLNIKVSIEHNDEEDIDVNKIRTLCKTLLGYELEPDIFINNKKDEVNEKLKNISETIAKEYDCFMLFFLGQIDHSKETDDQSLKFRFWDGSLPIDEIQNCVKKSSYMAGKPKIFVFQADDTRLLPTTVRTKAKPIDEKEEPEQKTKKVPTDADMLIITSTIPQLLANTQNERFLQYTGFVQEKTKGVQPSDLRGSFLIETFVETLLDKSNRNIDILTLTTKINGKIEDLSENVRKDERFDDEINQQILDKLELPLTTSTLTKLVVFKK